MKGAGLGLGLLGLGVLGLVHCGSRTQAPAPVQAVPEARPLEPWSWHFVGGVLVVEGELDQPTVLTLKGRTLGATCRMPLGPVRWELYRPPPGEVAELRNGEGKLLARWDFDAKPDWTAAAPAPPPPASAPGPPPPAAAAAAARSSRPSLPAVAPAIQAAAKAPPAAPAPGLQGAAKAAPAPPVPVHPPLHLPPPGPWARTEPHLPLPAMKPGPAGGQPPASAKAVPSVPAGSRPAPAPPAQAAAKAPPAPATQAAAKASPAPPAPARPPLHVPPPGPWARTEPHLPLPAMKPGPVGGQPPASAKAVPPVPAGSRPAPAPPAQAAAKASPAPPAPGRPPLHVPPPGPWARTEPHLPLPAMKPGPARVQPPALAKAAPAASRPAPAPPAQAAAKVAAPPPPAQPPLPLPPPGPWARTEPHLPLPAMKPWPAAARTPALARTAPPAQAPVKALPGPAGQAAAKTPGAPVQPPNVLARIPVPAPMAKLPPPPARIAPAPPAPVPAGAMIPAAAAARIQAAPAPHPPPPPPARAGLGPVPGSQLAPPVPAPQLPPQVPSVAAAAERQLVPGDADANWPGAGEGLNLLRGPKGDRRICMTFDGGSTAEVATDILDVLHERGIRTTMFLTGDFILRYPDLVRRMVKEGHELGNHTLTHPHFAPHYKRDPRWTKELFQKELLDADRAFYKLTGRPLDPYWRAPFGEHTKELRQWAEELGYRHVGWSEGADTLDWATVKEYNLYRSGIATLEKLDRRMKKSDGDGLIVLMHLGSMRPAMDRPAKYLGPFMDRAIKDGWHFVTIGDYLKSMGQPRWESSRRVAALNLGATPVAP